MKELHDLELLLASSTPIIIIESLEEPRVLQLFTHFSLRGGEPLFGWTVTDGLRRLEMDLTPQRQTADPSEVLKHIKATSQPGNYVLLDFHPYLDSPIHVRLIKEIAQTYNELPRTLIFVSHALDIPVEVRHMTVRFTLRLPDRARILTLIKDEAQQWRQKHRHRPFRANREAVDKLANNLLGVTESDARRLIHSAIEHDGAITHDDLKEVMKAKYRLLSPEGVIGFEYDTAGFSDIAGLRNLKQWLKRRRDAFSGVTQGLDQPKGIMLLGVQGCGKSLAAKAVAGHFGVPLLRLDFGALYNKFYGETEKNLRQALETADVMAPCILWLDEIEKGVAPSDSDDGVSQRVLGSLLTWMAERTTRVFIVATSNDITRLPPELVRKGRLDEIFFVDLPDGATRKQVFDIHLRSRNQEASEFDLDALAQASVGFSGAGIEQIVVSALYSARAQNTGLSESHLREELERTQPLSVVMAEKIDHLRAWARNRTVPAN